VSVPASVGTSASTKLAAWSVSATGPVIRSAGTVCGSASASSPSNRSVDSAASDARQAVAVTPVCRSQAVANLVATVCGVALPGLVLGGCGAGGLATPSSGIGLVEGTSPPSAPGCTSEPVE
jgi:hypothetical protein